MPYIDPYPLSPSEWSEDDLRDFARTGTKSAIRLHVRYPDGGGHKALIRGGDDGPSMRMKAMITLAILSSHMDQVEAAEALVALENTSAEDIWAHGYAAEDRATGGAKWRLEALAA